MVKRCFDILFSFVGVLLTAPFFLLVAIIIKLSSKGPIFFRQTRIRKGGVEFKIIKFRTMIVDAEKFGGQITPSNDPRITTIGKLLRKTKLDELPQLINVLLGEMSLVGPRPEVPHYVNLYTPDQQKVIDLVPGITDPASIKYSNEGEILAASSDPEKAYIDSIMPEKIRMNLEYAAKANIFTDMGVILKTLARVVSS